MSDLISRKAAIDAIERLILPQTKGETVAEEVNRVAWRCAINCAEEIIGHLPPAEPKQGKLTHVGYDCGLKIYECSVCHKRTYGRNNYCPNCGAEMERSEK